MDVSVYVSSLFSFSCIFLDDELLRKTRWDSAILCCMLVFFQEHDIGVWVSRAIPSGNGAKQGVQYSDQLAAINGRRSVHTTIDEVASNVSSTPNGKVELTFLRYVGPLRPVPGTSHRKDLKSLIQPSCLTHVPHQRR